MSELLKINGEAVDIPDTGINLGMTFESNLLSIADGVKSSWSYSVDLPKTLRNDAILGYCDRLNLVERGAHKYYDAEYHQNGKIIVKGKLKVITTDTDGYKCCLYWGFDGLEAIKAKDAKLNTLATRESTFVQLSSSEKRTEKTDFANSYGFVVYESGINTYQAAEHTKPLNLPAVSVGWILDRIAEKYHVALNLPANAPDVRALAILLTSNKASLTGDIPAALRLENKREAGDPPRWVYYFTEISESGMIYDHEGEFRVAKNGKITYHFEATSLEPFFASVLGRTVVATLSSGRYRLEIDLENFEVEQGARLDPVLSSDQGTDTFISSLTGGATMTITPENNTNSLRSKYSIAVNLPDMNCFDFLKNICVIAGVSMVSTTETAAMTFINCLSWDASLIDTPTKIKDAKITGCAFDDSNLAQSNRIAFATPKAGEVNEGFALCEDDTLTPAKDWFVSAFALVGEQRQAYIYKVEDDGKITSLETPPFICALVPHAYITHCIAAREWLPFSDLSTRFNVLLNAMKKPTIINATMPLQEIDTTRAVYEPTTAQRYAVLKIYRNGKESKMQVSLIKL